MKILKKLFAAIRGVFREPDAWKLDYLHASQEIGPYRYPALLVDLQARLNLTDDPPGDVLGTHPPPKVRVVAPQGISPRGEVFITNPQTGNRVLGYYHYGLNEIRTAALGWEAGLTPWLAEHEYAHYLDNFRREGTKSGGHHKAWFDEVWRWG